MLNIPILKNLLEKKGIGKPLLSDFVDRLHSRFTVLLLAAFSIMVGSKQYFGSPIDCLINAEVTGMKTWQSYVLDYCYIQGTRRYQLAHAPSLWNSERYKRERVDYYQWVPLFFVFQMACFLLPGMFWTLMQSFLYVDMKSAIEASTKISELADPEKRKSQIDFVAQYLFRYFHYRRISRRGFASIIYRLPASATAMYILTKILHIINAGLQMYIVAVFLGFPASWGFDIIHDFITNDRSMTYQVDNLTLHYFPLRVMCTLDLTTQLKNSQEYNIECLLTINWINEKLFVILWVWMLILICISLLDLFVYIVSVAVGFGQSDVITALLQGKDLTVQLKDRPYVETFVHSFLGPDGSLLLRFMKIQSGCVASQAVMKRLWDVYRDGKGLVHVETVDDAWSDHYAEFPIEFGAGDSNRNLKINNNTLPI